jgi:putative acetyltransferase
VSLRLVRPNSALHWRQARELVEEYAASLNVDLGFQDFAHELASLETEYGPDHGAFVLAEEDGVCLGCVGLRTFSPGVGEIKRLYVRPAGRGRRVGRRLAEHIIALAAERGFERVVLDTLPFMNEAQALYLSLGFKPTAAYRYNPVEGSAFLELPLR